MYSFDGGKLVKGRKYYIADIPNAQLRLTSGDRFRQSKPAAGYQDRNASVGTRTQTPIRNITRQVLQDQGSFRVQDAVRNVRGQPGTNFGGSGETLYPFALGMHLAEYI